MAIDQGVLDGTATANYKVLAESATQNMVAHQNIANNDAISHQRTMNMIRERVMAQALEAVGTTSVSEGLGIAAAQRGDLDKLLAGLGNTIAQLQQAMKGAQSTPPPTP
jgi:hypothetical protein